MPAILTCNVWWPTFGNIDNPLLFLSPYHRCSGSGRRWYADTRVERDGLPHRCLPYYQRWTNWASVKYVKKTWKVSLSIGVRTTMIVWVIYLMQIFKMFHGLTNNPVYIYIYIYIYNVTHKYLTINHNKFLRPVRLWPSTKPLTMPQLGIYSFQI